MYERSGSRFSVSGVGTQTITSSHAGDLGVVDGGAQEALRHELGEHLRCDVLDVRVAGVDAVDARGVRLDAEHGVAGLGERDGKGKADVAGSDDSDVFIHDDSA